MSEKEIQILPEKIIRTETTLTKFPIHKLSKRGKIEIKIENFGKDGKLETRWKVRNPPNPLAYKIDTLIINRKIEEQPKPLPKLIKLGSLRQIATELGIKQGNTNRIKESLLQNAGTLINAKFTYTKKDGKSKYIEIADTRYAVIFTGEILPDKDGKFNSTNDKAESTYIYLHDIYREILNSSQTRPLDYDYLKQLTPICQRFYELISFRIYWAIQNGTYAELRYSEFCQNAPQARFYKWEQVRPQMYYVHKPHLASEYIELVSVEPTRDKENKLDWIFVYKAGRKAKGEHVSATRNKLPRTKQATNNPDQLRLDFKLDDEPKEEIELTFTKEEEELISKMRKIRISDSKARELVKSHREAVEREILVFPTRMVGTTINNPSGLFIKAVENSYEPPQTFFELEEDKKAQERRKAQERKREVQAKIEKDKSDAWHRAKQRLLGMPEDERKELWERKRKKILESEKYKNADAGRLKILKSVIDGMIQSEIIDEFIKEESSS